MIHEKYRDFPVGRLAALKRLNALLESIETDFAKLNEPDVTSLRDWTMAVYKSNSNHSIWRVRAILGALLSFFVAVLFLASLLPKPAAGAHLLPIFILLMSVYPTYRHCLDHDLHLSAGKYLRELTPLSQDKESCLKMLDILGWSKKSRQYRDEVVATGRDLLVRDLAIVEQLSKHPPTDAEHEQACRLVHGIPE